MNPNHPVYARIIDLVQKAEIDSFRVLAGALGIGLESAMSCVSKLEDRGRLTRTQNGVFIAISQEEQSGVFMKPLPLPSLAERNRQRIAQLQAAAAARRAREPNKHPYRPRRKTAILDAVIEQSEIALRDAPPDDRELGRLIIESKALTAAQQREAKRAGERAAGQVRFEAEERRRAEKAEAKRLAKEAAAVERAKITEERRAAAAIVREAKEAERAAQRSARKLCRGFGKYCRVCEGLGERRPVDEPCPGCGESYEREVIEISVYGFSPLATFDAH